MTIQHYHHNNRLFDTKIFKDAVYTSGKTLSFCGVNSHHQNGKAQNGIKDVTTVACILLPQDAHRWTKAIHAELWPATLKNYTDIITSFPKKNFKPGEIIGRKVLPDTYNGSHMSKFDGTEIEANLNHFHLFGSPVYVLNKKLQQHNSHNKWCDQSKVGIFICHLPFHAYSVPLALNTQMGNVSPQFHCIYNDNFSTHKRETKFTSLCQHKVKLQFQL